MRDETCNWLALTFTLKPFNFKVRQALEIRLKVGTLLETFSIFFFHFDQLTVYRGRSRVV